MSNNFLFNAPTYLDFNSPEENEESGNVETYFDIDHEFTPIIKTTRNSKEPTGSVYLEIDRDTVITPITKTTSCSKESIFDDAYLEIDHKSTPVAEPTNNSRGSIPKLLSDTPNDSGLTKSTSLVDIYTEQETILCSEENIEIFYEKEPIKLRKSISVGHLLDINEDFTERTRFDDDTKSRRQHSSVKKCNFNDRINLLAQPKGLYQPKYISTAEQINKFYGTPTRFHSWQKKLEISNKSKPSSSVIPESPILNTKLRRRNNNVLSRDEIEKQQMEELKKFKIKARPVNQKILHGPIKPLAVPKKPSTIVKPFNLSENPQKKAQDISEPPENYEFHARPMPKAIYERSDSETKLDQKQNRKIFGSREKLNIQTVKYASIEKPSKPAKLTQTQPVPFSFETRDRQLTKRREALINKVLEEEKQAREFRANPAPKFISKKSSSLNSLKTIKSECDSNDPPSMFKAKPPTVLYKKPFEPQKSERALIEVTDVCLNTDRRAKEREEFERKQQEKRDRMAIERYERERRRALVEEQEIAKLRKEIVHTAQPIKQYKELKIEPSGKITTPMTPNFKTTERLKNHNKENTNACK